MIVSDHCHNDIDHNDFGEIDVGDHDVSDKVLSLIFVANLFRYDDFISQ